MKNKSVLFFSAVLLTIFCLAAGVFAFSLPKPEGYVSDFAGVMDAQTRESISFLISEVESKTSCEIAVVTVKTIGNDTIENAAVSLFKDWGIGKKGQDNGVLILVAVEDRKVKIEVGYGLEGILPDGLCGQILDSSMVPEFKNGNYSNGIARGVYAVASVIAKDKGIELTGPIPASAVYTRKPTRLSAIVNLIYLALVVIVLLRFPLLLLFGIGRGRRGRFGGGFGGGGYMGGGGGGFGGFGGGFSGGGGASRGW